MTRSHKRPAILVYLVYSESTIPDSTNDHLHLGDTPGHTLLAYIFVNLLTITFGLSADQPQLFLSLS